jgi:hypothetical protein
MYEYDYDAEAEIDRLKKEVANEERRTEECQREIARLRNEVRKLVEREEELKAISPATIFESWADFDDEESPESVILVLQDRTLGHLDTISFMAYCAGFQKAASFFNEQG